MRAYVVESEIEPVKAAVFNSTGCHGRPAGKISVQVPTSLSFWWGSVKKRNELITQSELVLYLEIAYYEPDADWLLTGI